jgi:hypothetical protein
MNARLAGSRFGRKVPSRSALRRRRDPASRRRAPHHDHLVAITVVDREDPYRHISLLGEVEEIYDDEGLADIDRLARRYTGAPYETRDSDRVSAWVRVDRWHGWDASRARVTHAGWDADGAG